MKEDFKAMGVLVVICIVACLGAVWFDHSRQNPQYVYVPPAKVKWSSLPAKEQQVILTVAKDYGDAHPKVVKNITDTTEANYLPMYLVWLTGDFHTDYIQSNDLEFSILADGTEEWAVSNRAGTINVSTLYLSHN